MSAIRCIRALRVALFGSRCHHHWTVVQKASVFMQGGSTTIPFAYDFVLQCDKCGWVKKVRT